MRCDVAVVGAGPAGLAVAAALVQRGLDVRVVTPDPDAAWVPTYAAWAHELPEDWKSWAEASWVAPEVHLDDRRMVRLGRTYVRIDRARLQERLRRQIGDRWVRGQAVGAAPLTLASGETIDARIVVDASGAGSALVSPRSNRNPGYQVAYGELVEADDSPAMLLMDYRGPAQDGPPSFLYAMPLSDGRCFVEETVLVGRPAPALEVLRARLHARLDRMGIRRGPALEVERCVIPMGLPLPRQDGPLAWGAAAGLVHPATGYSVGRSLRDAATLAAAIASGLEVDVATARARAWQVIWPQERQRAWAFYTFGMEALLRMDLEATREFFYAFFHHDDDTWAGWLAGDLALAGIPAAMTRHFGRVPWSVRASLVGTSMGRDGARLVGRLLGMD